MHIRIAHLIICLFVVPLFGLTQTPFTPEIRYQGLAEDDWPNDLVILQGGQTCILKGIDGGKEKKNDIALLFLNERFEKYQESIQLGGTADEHAAQFIQLSNGLLAIAGYSESRDIGESKGLRDGWLILYDPINNMVVTQMLLGGRGNDELIDLVEGPNRFFYACGQLDGNRIWLIKFDLSGKVVSSKFHHPDSQISLYRPERIFINQQGEIIVVGTQSTSKAQSPFYATFDPISLDKKAPIRTLTIGQTLADAYLDKDQALYYCGTDKRIYEKPYLAKLNLSTQKSELLFTTSNKRRGDDGVTSIYRDWQGHFWLAGQNKSHRARATRTKGWILHLDEKGKLLEESILGGNATDNFIYIGEHPSGNLIGAGQTASDTESKSIDTWIFSINTNQKPALANSRSEIQIQSITFVDQNQNQVLNEQEYAWLEVVIKNNSKSGYYRDVLKIEGAIPPEVGIMNQVKVPLMAPGSSQIIKVPIRANSRLSNKEIKLGLRLSASSIRANTSFRTFGEARSIIVMQPLTPAMNIPSKRNKEIIRSIRIKNEGELSSENLTLKVLLPEYVRTDAKDITIPALKPNESRIVNIQIEAQSIYAENEIPIDLALLNNKPIEQNNVVETSQTKIPLQDMEAVIKEVDATLGKSQIKWVQPRPEELSELKLEQKDFQLNTVLRISSPFQLNKKDLIFEYNNEDLDQAIRDPFDLKLLEGSKKGDQWIYSVIADINLFPGVNDLQLIIKKNGSERRSSPIKVMHNPISPVLHLYSIGVPHSDLKYTTKDARDFAGRILPQENKIYSRIDSRILFSKEETTAANLRKVIQGIKLKYDNGKIGNKDVIIFFISSHGITGNTKEEVYIYGSDKNPVEPKKTSINLVKDLKNILALVPCKKILFLDACHSGTPLEELNAIPDIRDKSNSSSSIAEAISKLLSINQTFQYISSSGIAQKSYEAKEWENGAFTEAILEAFDSNEKRPVELRLQNQLKPDQNEDNILTLGELYNYLSRRVPFLVKSISPKYEQKPYMKKDVITEKLPIFVY